MKYITLLTDEEILKLTDEDLERIITLKMAEEGVKLLAKPELPNYHEIENYDLKFYEIAGNVYRKRQTAELVQKALEEALPDLANTTYIGSGYHYKKESKPWKDAYSISICECYSEELAERLDVKLKENDRLKKNYETLLKEYEQHLADSQWIRDEVYNKKQEVDYKYMNFQKMLIRFNEYLELAENNEEQAWKFFEKAWGVNEETKQYILSHLQTSN